MSYPGQGPQYDQNPAGGQPPSGYGQVPNTPPAGYGQPSPPYGQPTAAYGQVPAEYGQSQPDYGQAPGTPPKSGGKKTGIIVVSIVAVLLLAAAGAFGGLYFSEKSTADQATAQIANKDKALADSSNQLKAAKSQVADAQNKNAAVQKCADAGHALAAAGLAQEQDQAKVQQLGVNLVLACW
jgi:uncharacterized protein HemX